MGEVERKKSHITPVNVPGGRRYDGKEKRRYGPIRSITCCIYCIKTHRRHCMGLVLGVITIMDCSSLSSNHYVNSVYVERKPKSMRYVLYSGIKPASIDMILGSGTVAGMADLAALLEELEYHDVDLSLAEIRDGYYLITLADFVYLNLYLD